MTVERNVQVLPGTPGEDLAGHLYKIVKITSSATLVRTTEDTDIAVAIVYKEIPTRDPDTTDIPGMTFAPLATNSHVKVICSGAVTPGQWIVPDGAASNDGYAKGVDTIPDGVVALGVAYGTAVAKGDVITLWPMRVMGLNTVRLLPAGGADDAQLTKTSADDYEYAWE